MKRTRLRRVSQDTAKRKRQTDPLRKKFVEAKEYCEGQLDGCDLYAIDPHEIARGNAKEECEKHTDLILALCRKCHDEIQNWKPERQFALRVERSRQTLNKLRGRADSAISRADVIAEWEKL